MSAKNIRVAYQTLMIYHESLELFPFIPKRKDEVVPEETPKSTSTINFFQERRTQQKIFRECIIMILTA